LVASILKIRDAYIILMGKYFERKERKFGGGDIRINFREIGCGKSKRPIIGAVLFDGQH